MERTPLIRKFDKQAPHYEKRRKEQTQKVWRETLLRSPQGHVLEVAVGAGANFPYYPKHVEVTAVDFSPEMIRKAKESAHENGIQAKFMTSDIERLSFPENSFDTIISTLSLCGYQNPSAVLNQFNQWCKEDGAILLMEHGLSSHPLLSRLQRILDSLAVRIAGCHQNRDIMQLIHASKLIIEKQESHRLGMVHLVWARPQKGMNSIPILEI